jgi:polysaccharide export outer membrane protein
MRVVKAIFLPVLLLTIILSSAVSLGQETPFTEYRIGPSDILSITVWQQPELSRTVTVRPDGVITYPLVGDMQVASLTPLELRDLIAESLEDYVVILLSEVTVSVDAINSYTVSVMGEVNSPGRFSFQSPVTVIDVLAEAGGFTAFASSSKVVILRTRNGVSQRIPFDYRRVEREKSASAEMVVFPGDIIIVP